MVCVRPRYRNHISYLHQIENNSKTIIKNYCWGEGGFNFFFPFLKYRNSIGQKRGMRNRFLSLEDYTAAMK